MNATLLILEGFGVPQKLIILIRLTMKESRARAFIEDETSRPFEVTTGAWQGDSICCTI
jgi:hypothetical protein